MTAPIRSMAGLVEALRTAQVERELSYELLDAVSGLQNGYTAKILGPLQSKRLGPVSTFPLLGALGKALAIVDDPEQIAAVQGRWVKRKIVGGSARQIRLRDAAQASRSSIEVETQETLQIQAKEALRERMKVLGKLGGLKGGKSRAKKLGKRARQQQASHAARKRWSKKDG